jgi:hypothetical protein
MDDFVLQLRVSDPDVVTELKRQPEGDVERYALSALRLGAIALRQARGELDATSVREEASRLLASLQAALSEHALKFSTTLSSELTRYFDPCTGDFTQRVERLVKTGGELDAIILGHLDHEGTLARTLAKHVGEDSPIFKLLSPDEGAGLRAAIEAAVKQQLVNEHQVIASEFSLDRPDSALSRLVRELTGANGKLKKDFQDDLQKVVGQFSLDDPNSGLSRLVAQVERAKLGITQQFSLDDPDSSLSRLKRSFDRQLEQMAKGNQDFQAEVRETLAGMRAAKRERLASTLHGLDFEDAVGVVVAEYAQRRSHVYQPTGEKAGRIPRCKVGDHLVTLGAESIGAGNHFAVEAKEDASYGLVDALHELEVARRNRQAQAALFVFSTRTAPADLEPIARYGRDVIVVWDAEDRVNDAVLQAALCLTACLCAEETAKSVDDLLDLDGVDRAIKNIARAAKDAGEIKKWAETVRSNGTKIVEKADRLQASLASECSALEHFLVVARNPLKPEGVA